ncbi:MAG: hypothetical protein RR671_02500 [Raoultibacter sp.]
MQNAGKNKSSTRGRWIGVAAACGVVASLAAGSAPALASVGTTSVTLQADSEQINVTIPTTMAIAIKADGTFTTPDAASMKIINNSIFSAHVASIKATAQKKYQLVSQSNFGTEVKTDALWFSITPGAGTAIQLGSCTSGLVPNAATDWNMSKADSQSTTDEIALSSAGAIKNVSDVATTAEKVLEVAFTVRAGTRA